MKGLEMRPMYVQAGPSPVTGAGASRSARLRTPASIDWMPAAHANAVAARTGPWEIPI